MNNASSKRQRVALGGAEGPTKGRKEGTSTRVLIQAVEGYLVSVGKTSGDGKTVFDENDVGRRGVAITKRVNKPITKPTQTEHLHRDKQNKDSLGVVHAP